MKRKSLTIATVCQKGGVGKTTSTINQAAHLADVTGCRVLVIDCDGQSHMTTRLLKGKRPEQLAPYETSAAFFDDAIQFAPNDMIHETPKKGLDIVPANEALAAHGWPNLAQQPEERTHSIRRFIERLNGYYPFILIDTSPTLRELTTWAALIAADYAYTPIQPEALSGNAINPVLRFVRTAQEVNPDLHMLGFLISMVDMRCNDHKAGMDAIRHHHGDLVFKNIVPRLADFRNAFNQKLPIGDFNKHCAAAEVSERVTKEIYQRVLEHQQEKANNSKQVKEAA